MKNINPFETILKCNLERVGNTPMDMVWKEEKERMRKKKKRKNIIAEKENKNDAPLGILSNDLDFFS